MRIRRAILADVPAILTLEKRAATAAHWSVQQYETAILGEAPARVVLIVEDQGTGLQGFIVGKFLQQEWEIENMIVAEHVQRRGLGSRLLREFLDLARGQGAQAVFLEVRESNAAARRLYEKCAFVESGRRKVYYREPDEDAIVYRATLP
ncbi:MAG TPA: ribosomal protein S18-alanine N-acetyltransferase [Terriglobales bacterium]|nr:ribosomal protein S18-alanine N-acetyltransferase [Terriglobales bacterium]